MQALNLLWEHRNTVGACGMVRRHACRRHALVSLKSSRSYLERKRDTAAYHYLQTHSERALLADLEEVMARSAYAQSIALPYPRAKCHSPQPINKELVLGEP